MTWLVLAMTLAHGSGSEGTRYVHEGRSVHKVEAMGTLLKNPDAQVEKCVLQELTEKGTLRGRKPKSK